MKAILFIVLIGVASITAQPLFGAKLLQLKKNVINALGSIKFPSAAIAIDNSDLSDNHHGIGASISIGHSPVTTVTTGGSGIISEVVSTGSIHPIPSPISGGILIETPTIIEGVPGISIGSSGGSIINELPSHIGGSISETIISDGSIIPADHLQSIDPIVVQDVGVHDFSKSTSATQIIQTPAKSSSTHTIIEGPSGKIVHSSADLNPTIDFRSSTW